MPNTTRKPQLLTREQIQRASEKRIRRAFDTPTRVSAARKRRSVEARYVIETISRPELPTMFRRVRAR